MSDTYDKSRLDNLSLYEIAGLRNFTKSLTDRLGEANISASVNCLSVLTVFLGDFDIDNLHVVCNDIEAAFRKALEGSCETFAMLLDSGTMGREVVTYRSVLAEAHADEESSRKVMIDANKIMGFGEPKKKAWVIKAEELLGIKS